MWGERAPPTAPPEGRSGMPDAHAAGLPKLRCTRMRRRQPTGLPVRLCHMRAVVSRVAWARVVAGGELTGEIGLGLLVLVGVTHGDTEAEAGWLAAKVAALRVFDDDQGKMNRSVTEVGGAALVVSQFTLYGNAGRGRRPSYVAAAPPEVAAPLVEAVAKALAGAGVPVAGGRFGAHMLVESAGDGPVTILLDTAVTRRS